MDICFYILYNFCLMITHVANCKTNGFDNKMIVALTDLFLNMLSYKNTTGCCLLKLRSLFLL